MLKQSLKSLWMVAIGLAISCSEAEELEPFVLGAVSYIETNQRSYEEWLLTEALLRHGYQLEVRRFPGKRLIVELNNGNLDGDMHRTVDLSRGFNQIVRVESVLSQSCGWIYQLAQRDADTVQTRIGIYRGTPGGRALINKIMPGVDIVLFSTLEQATKLLANGRVDYVGLIDQQTEAFRSLMPRPIVPTMQLALPFNYAHFHRRHAQLAKDIEATILSLQRQYPMPLCELEERFKRP
ncbi:MAG: hypothetical protein ACRBBW_10160 [Cellvibrionaceae bacterium]